MWLWSRERKLLRACDPGHYDTVDALLTKGDVDVNTTDKDGWTPLLLAVKNDRYSIVERLLQAKADPKIALSTGHTALHLACTSSYSDVARLLLEAGADLHAKDKHGREPMHLCLIPSSSFDTAILSTLQVLVLHGATWDEACDAVVASTRASTIAPSLRVCVTLWVDEHASGLSLTQVPFEVITRGLESTQAYIDGLQATKSSEAIDQAATDTSAP